MRKSHIAVIVLSLTIACLSACVGSERNESDSGSTSDSAVVEEN